MGNKIGNSMGDGWGNRKSRGGNSLKEGMSLVRNISRKRGKIVLENSVYLVGEQQEKNRLSLNGIISPSRISNNCSFLKHLRTATQPN